MPTLQELIKQSEEAFDEKFPDYDYKNAEGCRFKQITHSLADFNDYDTADIRYKVISFLATQLEIAWRAGAEAKLKETRITIKQMVDHEMNLKPTSPESMAYHIGYLSALNTLKVLNQ